MPFFSGRERRFELLLKLGNTLRGAAHLISILTGFGSRFAEEFLVRCETAVEPAIFVERAISEITVAVIDKRLGQLLDLAQLKPNFVHRSFGRRLVIGRLTLEGRAGRTADADIAIFADQPADAVGLGFKGQRRIDPASDAAARLLNDVRKLVTDEALARLAHEIRRPGAQDNMLAGRIRPRSDVGCRRLSAGIVVDSYAREIVPEALLHLDAGLTGKCRARALQYAVDRGWKARWWRRASRRQPLQGHGTAAARARRHVLFAGAASLKRNGRCPDLRGCRPKGERVLAHRVKLTALETG